MFEAIIITSLALSGISTVQTGIALGQIGAHIQASEALARQSLIENGTLIGKTIRTARYCHEDTFADSYHAFMVARMSPYGEYGQLMIATADQVSAVRPDIAHAPKGWSCAQEHKAYAAAMREMSR